MDTQVTVGLIATAFLVFLQLRELAHVANFRALRCSWKSEALHGGFGASLLCFSV